MVGPGDFPFMVTIGLVEHNLVAFFNTTYTEHSTKLLTATMMMEYVYVWYHSEYVRIMVIHTMIEAFKNHGESL
jgi:hypothetical protein